MSVDYYKTLTKSNNNHKPGKEEMPEDESTHRPTNETEPGVRFAETSCNIRCFIFHVDKYSEMYFGHKNFPVKIKWLITNNWKIIKIMHDMNAF